MKRFIIPVLGTAVFLTVAGIACLLNADKIPKHLKFKRK